MTITIKALQRDWHEEASRLLARSFVTNPLHIAVFGADRLDSNVAFFKTGLTVMKGEKLVAADGTQLLGVIHWVDSPFCQFSATEKLRLVPAMIRGFGVRRAARVGSWLSAWAQRDPAEHHCHLGPIGVSPDAQGQGIGRRLMEQYCDQLNRSNSVGYLETDRPGNVDFYKRFGFEVTASAPVQGVTCYFMRRSPS
jgi:ribosomal protein S18 acetylase RimI-like enzyme